MSWTNGTFNRYKYTHFPLTNFFDCPIINNNNWIEQLRTRASNIFFIPCKRKQLLWFEIRFCGFVAIVPQVNEHGMRKIYSKIIPGRRMWCVKNVRPEIPVRLTVSKLGRKTVVFKYYQKYIISKYRSVKVYSFNGVRNALLLNIYNNLETPFSVVKCDTRKSEQSKENF